MNPPNVLVQTVIGKTNKGNDVLLLTTPLRSK